MTESATLPKTIDNSSSLTLGSFEVGPRVFDRRSTSDPIATFEVTGRADTRFAGTKAFASCIVPNSSQAEHQQDVASVLDLIRSLAGPTLVPILETGISGKVAYIIEAEISGERLSTRLERVGRKLSPRAVAGVLDDTALAVDQAAEHDVHHGAISTFSIWIDGDNRYSLGGFGLAGRSTDGDIQQIAQLAIELLAGTPLKGITEGVVSPDRIRGHVNGLTERVALVIARAFTVEAPNGFESATDFASAFRTAVKDSALDLVAGAWEAVSRSDLPMAELLVAMIAGYDPDVNELPLLRLKLGENAANDPCISMTRLLEASRSSLPMFDPTIAPADPSWRQDAIASTELPELSPEIVRLLSGPVAETKAKSRTNYWVIFAAGIFAMVIIMVVLAALTFASS